MTPLDLALATWLREQAAEDRRIASAAGPDWDDAASIARWESQPHGRQCGWRLGEGLSSECECDWLAQLLARAAVVDKMVEAWLAADKAAGGYPGTEAGIEMGLAEACEALALLYVDRGTP
jgi:hypothetical protein